MKQADIEAIAKEYGVTLWFNWMLTATYNGKDTDLMKRGQAYRVPEFEWRRRFRELTRSPLANYWTSSVQQQDKLRQNVTTRGAQR